MPELKAVITKAYEYLTRTELPIRQSLPVTGEVANKFAQPRPAMLMLRVITGMRANLMKNRRYGVLCALLWAGFIASVPGGQAADFSAHRGLYDMSLVKANSGSGISGVAGKMAVEWHNSCTGWAFQYQSVIDVTFEEGTPVRLTSNATSWESSDGTDYRFDVRHLTNGKEMERIEGVAKLSGDKGGGYSLFNHPKPTKFDLPGGTLFPVAHSMAIVRAAKGGKSPQFVSRNIFDGMDVKGLYQVNAIIGPVMPPKIGFRVNGDAMKKMASWPVSLAYFAVKSGQPTPDHEIKMRLFANGVADDLVMDFGSFIVRARLGQVDLLDPPACK